MTIPVLTFFNNKGGVGKTSLVYHLSWMLSDLGKKVVSVDLDPQANLSAAFLTEEELDCLWNTPKDIGTVFQAVAPLQGIGDIAEPVLKTMGSGLYLLPGDVALSSFEETLSEVWPASLGDNNLYRPFRILSSFWQVIQIVGRSAQADLILVDVGPNLGAINRSALIATKYVVIPVGADLFSLQGLKNLGPTLRNWRSAWQKRLRNWPDPTFDLPGGEMCPVGYVTQQHGVRLSRPVKAYDRWINRIPGVYREGVLQKQPEDLTPQNDPLCLATLKHYRSLAPLAQEKRRPIFSLTPADGAIGSHANAVREAYSDFERLATRLLEEIEFRSATNEA
jgi:chromosome partitioning protein